MNMRKIILFLLAIGVHFSQAQTSIVFEKLRCFSATGMTMGYFKDNATRKTIAAQLSKTLLNFQSLPLKDTTTIPNIEYLNSVGDLVPADISFTDENNSFLHLYMDIFEIAASTFFSFPDNTPTDSTLVQRTRSVFLIKGTLLSGDKKIAFSEQINVIVSAAETAGMGIVYKYFAADGRLRQLVATQKGFAELMKASFTILFNPKNQSEMVEMKVSPAFIADNYIAVNIINQPRVYVATKKNISIYRYKENEEMIRMG
ncbi:MAG: hypothetical protein ABI581_03370, partial [Sediminibacterium sp.]